MKRKELRDFFVKQMDRLLDLELLSQNQKSYWNLTSKGHYPYNTNLLLLEKIDLSEVWEGIPTPLKFDLELFYNFVHNNINIHEMYNRSNKEPEIFWVCVDYGCYQFFLRYYQKYKFRKEEV